MLSRRVFSGIQPSGIPHLGNYLGAITSWVSLQDAEAPPRVEAAPPATPLPPPRVEATPPAAPLPPPPRLLFCVVDLHAMTQPYDAPAMRAACRLTAASLLACGIDPARSTVFRQSAVRGHAELAWVLGCVTPLGVLSRMTQFKDKTRGGGAALEGAAGAGSGGSGDSGGGGSPNLGLLSYPVLQAADILLYRATHVPVGEDQAQHLELARTIAEAFHRRFGQGRTPLLPPPVTMSLGGASARVMSLRDATRKMSKSDADDGSRINLTDSADAIAAKLRRAVTDSDVGFTYDVARRPAKSNLLALAAALAGEPLEAVAARHASATAADFKRHLTEVAVERIVPIGDSIRRLLADPNHVDELLAQGAERAGALAEDTMREVRGVTGLG